ncbi:divalent metal cation transporter [Agrobacterium rhizogenes]|uniref:NRAMP family divalent metal transporter n=1 Tax=Rhizobium rhizogenes TaxID=359 RepID=UPI0015717B96|nr:divalent metal cation transporter [Rhizobium rhizogenes]NTH16440.1 divalent metal cation transporter [Rhizobium rhizogenes]NTI78233.1 divalent metal cation transporter [Rhizobium rhizogenes]
MDANSTEPPPQAANEQSERPNLLKVLGPGLITGASDDDPSGIATYSQVGAQFGYSMGWVMLFSWPLMCAIQEISARIGRVTGQGIAGNLKRHYPVSIVYGVVSLLVVANVINIGADLGAMGAALKLLIGGPALIYVALFGLASVLLEVFSRYSRYVSVLKWLTLSLFAYVGVAFVAHIPWGTVGYNLVVPHITFDGAYITAVVAVLGTTISPYLFFWQAEEEVEEVKERPQAKPLERAPEQAKPEFQRIQWDTYIGMLISNVVALFIILTTAATLNANGITDIQTSSQAAEALRPIAGPFAFFIFALGIIGTGLLALPVLAGSSAYALGETFGWPVGLSRTAGRAKAFYGAVAVATLLGIGLNFSPIDPIKALFWSAVINGVVAVPVMALMMHLSSYRPAMGEFKLHVGLKVVGWLATLVMAGAAIGLFVTW